MKRALTLVLAVLATILGLSLSLSPVGAQEAPSSETLIVHRVDSTSDSVTALAISSQALQGDGNVTVVQDGAAAEVTSAVWASSTGIGSEMVFIIDSSQGLATGDIFNTAKAAVADAIRSLPNGTIVSVIDAGDTSIVAVRPTQDLADAATRVDALELSNTAVLYNAMDRAGTLLSDDPATIKSVIIFSGSVDDTSIATPTAARTGLISAGAQVATVTFKGGDPKLGALHTQAGGVSIAADSADTVTESILGATELLSDRVLVTFAGTSDSTVRADVDLTIGDASTRFGYAGGMVTDRIVSLTASPVVEESGLSFFGSSTGLIVAVGLTFAAIGLGIFTLGSLFASGETSLEGLIDRYSGHGDGEALSEEDSIVVQTALVQRAVELSESFAEDRGFLAKVEGMLERAKIPLRAGEAMSIYAAVIVISSFLGFILFGGLIGFVVTACLAAFVQIGIVNFKARRRMRQFEAQLPDALQLLAGTLRAGYSLPQGLEAVSHEIADPMGYELRRVMTEARLGRELEDALGSTAERLESPDFAWAVMAIGIQREVGGNLNELLMTVSDTMIARERLKGEVAALTAEGKMSAILLGGLPPGLGIIMWVMNPLYMNKLFDTFLGNVFLGLGTVSALIGFAWMKKVITINV